uniref:Ig-like domain-containing protein n=1 Tax=Callorhinchus milii TaxID=7868 RepID=A0A4W3GGH8_CALMI
MSDEVGKHTVQIKIDIETAGLSKQEGDTISLSCSYTTSSSFANFSVSWYRQSPGEELKCLFRRKPSGEEGNPTGDNISASLDTAKKISILTIAGLRLTDSAMYHCALMSSIHKHFCFLSCEYEPFC